MPEPAKIFLTSISIILIVLFVSISSVVLIIPNPNISDPVYKVEPIVAEPVPPLSQTIDINIPSKKSDETVVKPNSTIPFHQEINVTGNNSTVTIHNYYGDSHEESR